MLSAAMRPCRLAGPAKLIRVFCPVTRCFTCTASPTAKMWGALVRTQAFGHAPWMPLHAVFWALAIFAACAAADLLRQRFLEPLWLRLIDRLPPVRRELAAKERADKA